MSPSAQYVSHVSDLLMKKDETGLARWPHVTCCPICFRMFTIKYET